MKHGLDVNPGDLAMFIFLHGEDVSDKVVPIEEPPPPENVQNVEDRGGIGLLNPKGGGRSASGLGGEGGVNFSFLLGREKMGEG